MLVVWDGLQTVWLARESCTLQLRNAIGYHVLPHLLSDGSEPVPGDLIPINIYSHLVPGISGVKYILVISSEMSDGWRYGLLSC